MTPHAGGEISMEERVRGAETRLGKLEGWKGDVVDPFLIKAGAEIEDFGDFVTSFVATEKVRAELADERHKSNTFRLNFIMVIITIGLFAIGFLEYVKH